MPATIVTPTFSPDLWGKHAAYVQELSRKYSALSKLVLDQPSPPPHSPLELDESCNGVLCERVRDAWATAQGNPADGKWVFLTQLLRMGVTSGRRGRWLGTRIDVKSPEEPDVGSGWLLTNNEVEWNDWERKFNQDRTVRAKVESWKRRVDNHLEERMRVGRTVSQPIPGAESATSRPPDVIRVAGDPVSNERSQLDQSASRIALRSSGGSIKQKSMVKPATSLGPLKDTAPFGFGVVKRSSQTSVLNDKPGAPGKRKLLREDVPLQSVPEKREIQSSNSRQSRQGDLAFPNTVIRNDSVIADNPDLSFIPPPFSESQLVTSTPKQIAKPLQPMSSPLPALTSSFKSYETKRDKPYQVEARASFSAITSSTSPKRHIASQHSDHVQFQFNTNNKRIFISPRTPTRGSDEEGRKLKKARTLPLIEASPSSQSGSRWSSAANLTPSSVSRANDRATASTSVNAAEQIPAGRTSSAVPTLTELLASAKRAKKKRLISNNASGLEGKEKDEPPAPAPAPEPRPDTRELDPTESADEAKPYFFNTFSIVQNLNNDPKTAHSLDVNVEKLPFDSESEIDQLANDVDLDLASPTKSLSSIAASDDEVEDDVDQSNSVDKFVLNSPFRPLATSTQVQPQYERPRGPFISKSNSNPRCDQGNKELNMTDSWASVYALRPGAAIAPSSTNACSASGPSGKAKDASMPLSHPTSSYAMYNSQFESAVAAHVDKVDKLLEKDVDFEAYAKALYDDKRTNLEEEGGDLILDGDSHSSGSLEEGSGRNGLSYGYGKAFDYDQSF